MQHVIISKMKRHRPSPKHRRIGEEAGQLKRNGGGRERILRQEGVTVWEGAFPWWAVWVVSTVTLAVRLNIVKQARNWWILHPDEVFQSIEGTHAATSL